MRSHPRDRLLQRADRRSVDSLGGKRSDLAFDQRARREQVEGARAIVCDGSRSARPGLAPLERPANEDAGADAHLDATCNLQRYQGLAHGGARNAQQCGEFPLRR